MTGSGNGAVVPGERVAIGIKALNEEAHIAEAVESALIAAAPHAGRVVLADSGSVDRTLEIASRYPVDIVQLANRDERSCGAGAQLAFQHADADFFYLLDGDMVLDPHFLATGLAFLRAHPEVAAVGGIVDQRNTGNAEFEIRAKTAARDGHWRAGYVDRLDCGGLYRVAAVRTVGYFADRNLHAFEEFDLGARLSSAGWKLARVDHPAVAHFGHVAGGYRLLWRRVRSGYAGSIGEVLRGAVGQPHLGLVLRRFAHLRNACAVMLWWIAIGLGLWLFPWGAAALLVAPLVLLSRRRRSMRLGLYSLASWNVNAWGLMSGFMRGRVPPTTPLASIRVATTHVETVN